MSTDQRLDSWKEIAVYLRRGVRTAQRWERDAGLPVRRVGGDHRAVYAFPSELDAWWRGRTTGRPDDASPSTPESSAGASQRSAGVRRTRVRPFLSADVAVDTESAANHASMAVYFFTLVAMGLSRPTEGLPAARAAADRALELEARNAEALAARAVIAAHFDRDWDGASSTFAQALSGDLVPALVRFHYACWFLAPLQRHVESLEQLNTALKEDPVYLLGRVHKALDLIDSHRYPDGLSELDAVLAIDAHFGPALGYLGRELAIAGRIDEARDLAERTYAAVPRHPNAVGFLAGMLHLAGERPRSDTLLGELARAAPWALPRARAEAFAVRQRWDESIDALRQAAAEKDPGLWILLSGTAGRRLRETGGWHSLAAMLRLPTQV